MIFKNAGSGEKVVLAARTFRESVLLDVEEWEESRVPETEK